jgi:hypothetical protein
MYGTGAYTFWACDDLFMEKQPDKTPQCLQGRGIAREVFQALGGGEAFLKAERDQFYGEQPKDKP